MKSPLLHQRSLHAFTLVELLVVIAIIALMATLMQPAIESSILKAQSMKCASNLRQIGNAVQLAITDNNNAYPQINQVANSAPPVYDSSVLGLVGVLGPYGINADVIKCPVDQSYGSAAACNNMAYPNPGSSYEWDPVFDDENPTVPVAYGGRGAGGTSTSGFALKPSRVRLCYDFNGVHKGHINTDGSTTYSRNVLYGDGHVSSH